MREALPFIPFVNTEKDAEIVRRHYSDAGVVRVCAKSTAHLSQRVGKIPLWVDTGLDALGQPAIDESGGFERWKLSLRRWQR